MSEHELGNNANAPRKRSILKIPLDEFSSSNRSVGSYVGSIDLDSYIAQSVATESDVPMVNTISKKATKNVLHLKMLVIVILIASASTLAACAYVFLEKSETKQFESKFGYDAHKVFEAIGSSLDKTLGLMDSVAVTLVSYAKDKKDNWPFVTLPDFGPRMAKLLPQTDAFTITILPIVTPDQREEWEAYSIQNDEWVNQSITIQETWDGYYGPIVYDWEQYGRIHGDFGDIESNVSRSMVPQWQNFPVIPEVVNAYNWDWSSIANPVSVQACIETQKSIISETYMIPNPDDPESQAESEGWIDWLSGYINPSENAFEPVIDVFYPIIDDISYVDVSNHATANKTLVGVIAVSIYWREFIRNILPPGSDGIIVMIRSPCNLPFTYQINGPDVTFIGVRDDHDSKYDHLLMESKLVDLKSFALRTGVYTGAPINESICPYTVSIYPSDIMKSSFTSRNGTIAVISVLLIFAFTSLVFFMYDCSVERRQNKIMTTAIRSSEIVDSLFPSNVRSQMYTAQGEKQKRQQQTGNDNIGDGSYGVDESMNGSGALSQLLNQGSIAQVYPNTTVIFADIVGFTAWSSTREPTHVFHLLETLYAGFDALAKNYGVFKIETIGDSYVAVVGLPKARKHHALIMVKFANDCRTKMQELTHELEPFLGPGTASLTLRIGLNSGPTTAGVLRGEKARFQLFGDTVNTAARMESNGAPNKIHLSEATAKLIESAGKGEWLTLREDKIVAKGKGLMQTYWCEPISSHTISIASNERKFNNDESQANLNIE